jgi:uncharacterized protein YbaA (DUF1428 family)
MAAYFDVYVLCVPKKNLPAYRRLAKAWGSIMKKYGYVSYRELGSARVKPKFKVRTLEQLVKPKKGEVVVASFVEFRSKAARDRANERGWSDPRMQKMMKMKPIFDMKRMYVGEFDTIHEG